MYLPALRHRILLNFEAQAENHPAGSGSRRHSRTKSRKRPTCRSPAWQVSKRQHRRLEIALDSPPASGRRMREPNRHSRNKHLTNRTRSRRSSISRALGWLGLREVQCLLEGTPRRGGAKSNSSATRERHPTRQPVATASAPPPIPRSAGTCVVQPPDPPQIGLPRRRKFQHLPPPRR